MEINKAARLAGCLVVCLVITSGASGGIIWNEQAPGAGSLPSTAQTIVDRAINPLSGVVGALN